MYFEFALSANQRGQRVASLLNKRVKLKGKQYLDVGCAYGGFLVAFGEKGAEPTGLDIEPSLLELAKFNFKDVGKQYPVHKRDVTKHSDIEEFQEAFDIITCNDVIEHVVDPQKAIHNIASMMRKDGIAYFEIPNCDAVEAVMSDGHYKLFGITQLSHNEAAAYFAEHSPETPYGVQHYLRLNEYRKIFDTAELEFEVLEETLMDITVKSILEALESLQMYLPQRILSVPINIRASVKLSIEQYLSAAISAPRTCPIEKKEFMLNFGATFWKVIARKRLHKAVTCGNNVVDLDFNNRRIPITHKGFKNHKFMEGYCNVCGKHSRFFFTDTALFRESLICKYCRTTSRYRSISRGLLTALESLTGIKARSIAELPVDGIDKHLSIYDTQPPFFYKTCAYPIPDYFQNIRWIDLYLSSFKPTLPLGEKIAPGVLNQSLEQLTFSDESFDILITSDVMEHVRLDFSAHREILRVLKPGGIYLFTVPNFRDRRETLVRVLVHDPDDPSKDEFLTEPEYHGDANSEEGTGALSYRSYGTEIDEILNKAGFDVSFCKTDFPEIGVMNTELFYCIKR
jgi:2-polyprenyl-3-methyl-5-hydroxy-6-metoxy-1,4-benzoquinol methylase